MNSTLIVIIIVLLLVIILALLSIIILVLKKNSHSQQQVEENKTVEQSAIRDFSEDFCLIHEKTQSQGQCAICTSSFCGDCLREDEGLNFCSEHFRFYLSQNWTELKTVRTTPDTPETAMPFYNLKDKLWREEKIPTLIRTHYKIDVEEDIIESHVKFISRPEDSINVSEQLKKAFKNV